jgi:hypothetical protein
MADLSKVMFSSIFERSKSNSDNEKSDSVRNPSSTKQVPRSNTEYQRHSDEENGVDRARF